MPINYIIGDIIQEFKTGNYSGLAYGCNCLGIMGAGVAKAVKNAFPEAYRADINFKVKNKLGKISKAETEFGTIFNFYTQYNLGANFELQALESCLNEFDKYHCFEGFDLLIPIIGCGIGGGNWKDVSKLIENHPISWRANITCCVLSESKINNPSDLY